MSCKCNIGYSAWGLPNCQIIPERFVRAFFTPDVRALEWSDLASNFLISSAPWDFEPTLSLSSQVWSQLWALVTPLADDAASERPEGVREEVGVNSYFVRDSARSLTFTFARKTAELGRMFRELRCASQLGVVLLDANGVVWGMRGAQFSSLPSMHEMVSPIPVRPPSIEPLMELAGVSTVQKWRLTFQLDPLFRDEDFVPLWEGRHFLTYQPPLGVDVVAESAGPNAINAFIFVRIAQGAGSANLIPLPQVPNPEPTAFDATGLSLGPTTWTPTATPGVFNITYPAGTAYIRFTPTQLAGTITPAGFDWFNFVIRL